MRRRNVYENKFRFCDDCGQIKKRVFARQRYGYLMLCTACYLKRRYSDTFFHKKCCICGEVKPVYAKNVKGESICAKCYKRKKDVSKK